MCRLQWHIFHSLDLDGVSTLQGEEKRREKSQQIDNASYRLLNVSITPTTRTNTKTTKTKTTLPPAVLTTMNARDVKITSPNVQNMLDISRKKIGI